MHDIFTDRYFNLEFHVKCDEVQEFIDLINALKTQTNLDPSIIHSYSGDFDDYCCATLRGSGSDEYVYLVEMIGEYACDYNNNAFLDIIRDKNPDIFDTVIHYAVDNQAIAQVKYILDIDSRYANAAGHRGKTPLYFAICNVDVPMVKLLLSYGADPSFTYGVANSNYLDHALWVYDHYYSAMDDYNDNKVAIVKLMMEHGAKPNDTMSPEQLALYNQLL